jgi:DNA repair exonuclease SbcCD ATPase subunit
MKESPLQQEAKEIQASYEAKIRTVENESAAIVESKQKEFIKKYEEVKKKNSNLSKILDKMNSDFKSRIENFRKQRNAMVAEKMAEIGLLTPQSKKLFDDHDKRTLEVKRAVEEINAQDKSESKAIKEEIEKALQLKKAKANKMIQKHDEVIRELENGLRNYQKEIQFLISENKKVSAQKEAEIRQLTSEKNKFIDAFNSQSRGSKNNQALMTKLGEFNQKIDTLFEELKQNSQNLRPEIEKIESKQKELRKAHRGKVDRLNQEFAKLQEDLSKEFVSLARNLENTNRKAGAKIKALFDANNKAGEGVISKNAKIQQQVQRILAEIRAIYKDIEGQVAKEIAKYEKKVANHDEIMRNGEAEINKVKADWEREEARLLEERAQKVAALRKEMKEKIAALSRSSRVLLARGFRKANATFMFEKESKVGGESKPADNYQSRPNNHERGLKMIGNLF